MARDQRRNRAQQHVSAHGQVAGLVRQAGLYTVEGKAYRSARIGVSRIGNAGCHRDQAVTAWRLASMAPGARIQVRYRPGDPGDTAVFLASLDFLDYVGVGLALVLFALGVSEARKRTPGA